MEWLDGETLADRLARGLLGPAAAARLGSRVLQALAVAHARGIVHRDLKPSNLFLPAAELDHVKLLDFGIARRAQDEWQVTRPGSVLGTPLYMAPEQARDGDAVDGRADIFSLGCVLVECATGKLPRLHAHPGSKTDTWDDTELAELYAALPRSLRAVLDRMLALEPAHRPDDAEELSAELASVADLAVDGPESQSAPRTRTLSGNEQRVAAVLVISGLSSAFADGQGEARQATLCELLAAHGARAERTVDGLTTIAFTGLGIPADQAAQAARLALRLKGVSPESSLGMSTSRTDMGGKLSLQEVTGKAARLLATTPAGKIHVDGPTARLIETRFEIQPLTDEAWRLLFEKGIREIPRTLMGKEVPCFGREREIGLLETLWDEACDEPGARVLLMTAPAGGGKSRVRHEFCERIQRRGRAFELLLGLGDPMRDAAPFALLGPALLAAAGITGGESEAVQRKRLTAHVSRFLSDKDGPRVAAFLGEMANLPFPDDDLLPLRAARKDARLMADQKLMAWLEWLEAECTHHPVLLVLEDLHWGDSPSVSFVDAALRVLAERPLLVLALARPEVDRRFPGAWKERNLQHVNLAPLSPRWSQRMVEHVAGDLPEHSARWIVERGQGNPFYLQELLRVAAEGGRVGDDSNLPDTVLGMVQARFDRFGPEAKLVLRAGSVFGQVFRADGVKALIDTDRGKDVERWLDILEMQEILFSRSIGDLREYAFRHALLRQAAYEMLPPAEKRLGHLLAGQCLEQAGERNGLVLADHFERAEEKERAIHWLGAAAKQALDADDLAETIVRVERGVRLGAEGEELWAMRVIESDARFWRGEHEEAERVAREAIRSGDARIRLGALSALFNALGVQTKYDEIATLFRALERPAAPELLNAWLDCVVNATAYLAVSGDNEVRGRTLALLEESRDRLDPILIGRAAGLKAHIARFKGQPTQVVAHDRWAANYFKDIGHRRAACETQQNLGVSLLEVGQIEAAEHCFREAMVTARTLDLGYLLRGGLQMLVNILAYKGDVDEARTVGKHALAVTSFQNDRRFQGCAEAYLSVAEYLAGDYVRGEQYARAAMATWDAVPPSRPFAVALLARALLAQGRPSEALPFARDAFSQLESMGMVDDGEATIRLALAECLVATGDQAAAQDAVASAAQWLRTRAETIDDPAMRESFLTRIPEHGRILELSREFEIP
jgi:tetratricopeptide (TPR) repeat protein